MKQKRHLHKIASVLAAAVILSACGGSPGKADAEGPNMAAQSPDVVFSPTETQQIRQVGTEDGAGQQAAGAGGIYELVSILPESCSILYTDYAAGRQVYLCSSPGCGHAGDYCTSYVDTSLGNIPGLIFSDDRLYLITPASADAAFPPQIEVMDANGANRTVLAKFKASQTISPGWCLADEKALYFLLEDVQSDGRFTQTLCAMEKANGALHKLLELEQGGWIMDGQGSSIYLKSIEAGEAPDRELFATEQAFEEACMDAMQAGALHKILKLNVSDPHTLTVVDEWHQNERSGGMLEGKMYYYDFAQDCFVEKDYETGESKTVNNTTGAAFNQIYVQAVIDGKLVFTGVTTRESDKNHVSSFYVDFTNNAAAEIGIMYAHRDRPVVICASDADNIYAYYDVTEEEIPFELDGNLEMTVVGRQQLGMISKQDFWGGAASFTPCAPAV